MSCVASIGRCRLTRARLRSPVDALLSLSLFLSPCLSCFCVSLSLSISLSLSRPPSLSLSLYLSPCLSCFCVSLSLYLSLSPSLSLSLSHSLSLCCSRRKPKTPTLPPTIKQKPIYIILSMRSLHARLKKQSKFWMMIMFMVFSIFL